MSNIKNDLFLRALKGEKVERPPVWMMRQAGRYLPDFMKLKAKYSFFERAETPELATEITVMPIHQMGVDAAILFSDILVIPNALEVPVKMVPGKGPVIENPIRTVEQVNALPNIDVKERLHYVYAAIDQTKEALNNEVPLIGFAGSPWTVFCYMVEGQGSKTFDKAKEFCYTQPEAAHALLQKITDVTIAYLQHKAERGCNALQIFDSWGGLLSPADYETFSLQYIRKIVNALHQQAPVILFGKGCWFALEEMAQMPVSALGVDWTITPQMAREFTKFNVTLQGNFDPARLLSPIPEIKKMTHQMIDDFGTYKYIANLGHGILPNIPVDHAKAFVDSVKEYSS
jgi:uroporphyrinogen decarboxylase